MAVGTVNGHHIHFGFSKFLRALQEISGGPQRRADTQPPLRILGRVWIL
jgi:hypothetical protein